MTTSTSTNSNEGPVAMVLGLLLLASIGIPVYQTFNYLKTGIWSPMPIGLLVLEMPPSSEFRQWYLYPQSWFGLHKMVLWILDLPIAILCFFSSIGGLLFWEHIKQSWRNWRAERKKISEIAANKNKPEANNI